jgi:hypothetical protein
MTLYSTVNRGIYGHMDGAWGGSDSQYIPQLRVTEEYIPLYSSVRHN